MAGSQLIYVYSEAMMTITTWVINLAPVGVFFLIGGQILEMDDFGVVAGQVRPRIDF